jgi:hypothetical protein
LRKDLYFRTQISANSCVDNNIVAILKQKGQTLETKDNSLSPEIGFFLNSVQFDQGKDKNSDSETGDYDIIGMGIDRALAIKFMSERLVLSDDGVMNFQGLKMGLFPNMLDEPSLREEMTQILMSRLNQGINPLFWDQTLTPYLNDEEIKKFGAGELTFKRFAQEKELLGEQIANYLVGLIVPQSLEATQERLGPFKAIVSPDPSWKDKSLLSVEIPGGLLFNVVNESATEAYALASQYKKITELRKMKLIDLTSLSDLVIQVDQILPTEEEFSKMTFRNLMDKTGSIMKVLSAFKNNPEVSTEALENEALFEGSLSEILTVNSIADEIVKALSKKPTTPEEEASQSQLKERFNKILGNPAGSQYTAFTQVETYSLYKGTEKARVEALNFAITDFQKNKSDYDAQADLILQVMTGANQL